MSGERRSPASTAARICSSSLGGVPQIRLEDDADGRALAELVVGEQLEQQLEGGLPGVERLHVDVEVGAELARRPQQGPQAPGAVLEPSPRRLRPDQRCQGGDLDRQVGARQAAGRVALERRPIGQPGVRLDERPERLVAARRVARRPPRSSASPRRAGRRCSRCRRPTGGAARRAPPRATRLR